MAEFGDRYVDERATAIAANPDGSHVYVAGTAGRDVQLIAYDAATGARAWMRRYGGNAGGDDRPAAVAVSEDGSTVVLTGVSRGTGGSDDIVTIAYDAATGGAAWLRRYDGPAHGSDAGAALAVNGSRVVVTGHSQGDAVTIAYSIDTGATAWTTRWPGGTGWQVAASPDGTRIFVSGNPTVALRAGDGRVLWSTRSSGLGSLSDLAVSPDGARVYLTGTRRTDSSTEAVTVAFRSATGTRVWARRAAGLLPAGVGVSADGAKVIVGGTGYRVVAYDAATGATAWAKRYAGSLGRLDAADLGVNPERNVAYLTGSTVPVLPPSPNPRTSQYVTVAFDTATGAARWTEVAGDSPKYFHDAAALAADPGGAGLYVTGSTFALDRTGSIPQDPEYDVSTVAYGTGTTG
jgi:hypothetical protein